MWKLEVSYNDISTVPAMAFYGLERALWELHLPHNALTRIPSESLTVLKKLSVLNLAGKFYTTFRLKGIVFVQEKHSYPTGHVQEQCTPEIMIRNINNVKRWR